MSITLKLRRHFSWPLIGLVVSLPVALATPPVRDMSPPNHGALSIVTASNTVRCADGLLSVQVRDVALGELLDEVASQCGIALVRYVALTQKLTLDFQRLPLEKGLRRILRSRSYVLQSAPPTLGKQPATAARAQTLWLLPQGNEKYWTQSPISVATSGAKFLADESALDVSNLESVLSAGNIEDREQAAVALGKRGHARAVAPLSRALADRNADVREAAIASLAEIGGTEAAQALATALRDDDPRMREQAVDALGEVGGQTATGLLHQALTDEVAFVRQAATEMLEQLSGTR